VVRQDQILLQAPSHKQARQAGKQAQGQLLKEDTRKPSDASQLQLTQDCRT
jgi:hypothetical protein